ncbi:MAG: hypothetical protein PVJ28_05230 [Acidimicrobiia bacterium]|jgi:hypothetical protein
MTIEYAKAYSRERMEHAEMRRLRIAARAGEQRSPRPIRSTIGRYVSYVGFCVTGS